MLFCLLYSVHYRIVFSTCMFITSGWWWYQDVLWRLHRRQRGLAMAPQVMPFNHRLHVKEGLPLLPSRRSMYYWIYKHFLFLILLKGNSGERLFGTQKLLLRNGGTWPKKDRLGVLKAYRPTPSRKLHPPWWTPMGWKLVPSKLTWCIFLTWALGVTWRLQLWFF